MVSLLFSTMKTFPGKTVGHFCPGLLKYHSSQGHSDPRPQALFQSPTGTAATKREDRNNTYITLALHIPINTNSRQIDAANDVTWETYLVETDQMFYLIVCECSAPCRRRSDLWSLGLCMSPRLLLLHKGWL